MTKVIPDIDSGNTKVLGELKRLEVRGKPYLFQTHEVDDRDERDVEWDGDEEADKSEGPRPEVARLNQASELGEGRSEEEYAKGLNIENEPPLTRDQQVYSTSAWFSC